MAEAGGELEVAEGAGAEVATAEGAGPAVEVEVVMGAATLTGAAGATPAAAAGGV